MIRWVSAVKHDVTFQIRHGFYLAYAFVVLVYIGILMYVPDHLSQIVGLFILYSDPALLGFFFIGAILLLEREQHIIRALFITPLRLKEYVTAKVCSLLLLSLLSAALIEVGRGGEGLFSPWYWLGIGMMSICNTLLGISIAVRCTSVNMFFLVTPAVVVPLLLPFVSLLSPAADWWLWMAPGYGAFRMLEHGLGGNPATVPELTAAVAVMAVWIVPAYLLASVSLKAHILDGARKGAT